MAVVRYLLSLFILFGLTVEGLAIPLREGFEGPFAPPNWQSFENGDGTAIWTRSPRIDVLWGFTAYARTENVAQGMATRQWLVTPRLAPDSANSQFSFYVRTQYPPQNGDDTLYVKLSTAGNGSADFSVTLRTLKPGIGRDIGYTFTPFAVDLHSYIGSAVYLAFERVDWGTGNNSIHIDSVRGPEMVVPLTAATSPHPVDHVTEVAVTAHLLWTNNPGTGSVDVYFSRIAADVETLLPAARVITGANVSAFIPSSNLLSECTYYWRVVSHNPWDQLAGPVWQFTTGSGGLGGDYIVGSGGDFATLTEAINALAITGISEPTTLRLTSGIYAGMVTIPAIPGASAFVPITLTKADSSGAVTLQSNGTSDSCGLLFNGASYFTLDGLTITAAGGSARHAVSMTAGSRLNTLRNCTLRGPGLAVTGSDALHLQGAGCDSNSFENVTARNAVRGWHIEGNGTAGEGNQVIHCRTDSVRCGIFVARQNGCAIHGNDISINGGAPDEVDGILVSTTLPGDTVVISGNRIHNIVTSGVYAVGVRLKPDSSSAVVRVFNNFIYGFLNTGGSQVRAIYASSGTLEIVSNSICVNNVAATGAAYSFYSSAIGGSIRLQLSNNLFVNREATSAAYNLFFLSNTVLLSSDYNIFFGTGSSYKMGRWGSDAIILSQWRSLTTTDAHSLEGDPGYLSDNDLHLSPNNGLAHQNGLQVAYLTEDMDGDVRWNPPDRGADEYFYNAPAADVAVLGFASSVGILPELTATDIPVIIQNRGSTVQSNVPLRLYFDGFQQAQTFVSLAALELDTVTLSWITPAAPDFGALRAQLFLSGDSHPENDSLSVAVQIVRQPLNGFYSVGGNQPDYTTLSAALSDMQTRGISGPVTLAIRSGIYSEQITVPNISGASGANTITIERSDSTGSVTLVSAAVPATMILNGARHVTIDGIDLGVSGPNYAGMLLLLNSDSNRIVNCTMSGSSFTATTACGIHTSGGGNDGNTFEQLTIGGFYYGIRLEGLQGSADYNNRVEHCTILTARCGIRTDFQNNSLIVSNLIHTGYSGAAYLCRGIYLGAQDAGNLVTADRNTLTGGQGSAGGCGIYAVSGAGTAAIQNNLISGWQISGSGSLYGILAGSGTANVSFNSLWLNDITATGSVIGIADTGSATTLNARNNIIQISETSNPVWALMRSGGTLNSDYNCLSNLAPQNSMYRVGRAGTTDYSSLTAWTSATGQDLHSLWGNPGFVDSLNLHISPENMLVSERGSTIDGILWDYDGDVRDAPPDIGADEYLLSTAPADFAMAWAPVPPSTVTAQSNYAISVRVSNSGTQAQSNVPIRLLFNRVQVAEEFVDLIVGASQTILFHWNTPPAELDSGFLQAQSFLPGDLVAQNDSVTAPVTIVGPPMAGTYDIGGGNTDFANPVQAAAHLSLRGISAAVDFQIFPGNYSGAIRLPAVSGADANHRIVFNAVSPDHQAVTLSTFEGTAVIRLEGADYITLRGVTVMAAGSCTTGVDLCAGASNNEMVSCSVIGSDSSNSATIGIRVQTDGNNFNRFDSLRISNAFTGIAFDGGQAGTQSAGNQLRNSVLYHARYGVSVSRQMDGLIEANDIQPGSRNPAAAACYGVYVSALGIGGSVTIIGNRIHGFTDVTGSAFNRAAGVYAAAASGATVKILSNFIYDFSLAGSLKISGVYLSSGDNQVLHNSIQLGNLPSSSEVSAIYISTAGSHLVMNNILVSLQSTLTSYGIWQATGNGLTADGNDIWGSSSPFIIGRIGAVNYTGLSAWQQAGYDLHGLSADPHFAAPLDLHISSRATVVNDRGIYTTLVTTDFDGQPRDNPPDIGADEYEPRLEPNPVGDLSIMTAGDSVTLFWSRTDGAVAYRVYYESVLDRLDGSGSFTVTDSVFTEAIPPGAATRFYYVTAISDSLPARLILPPQIKP
jgi:pectin methylesterase-like acyl-CoA thioesterase